MEKLNLERKNRKYVWTRENFYDSNSANVNDYILKALAKQKLVYCRFGDKYLAELEKKRPTTVVTNNQPSGLIQASTLLNIKKLIEE